MKNERYYVAFWLDRTRYAIDSCTQTLENTEGAITNGQSKETDKIGYTRRQDEQKHNKNTIQYVLDTTMHK
jgi:hypothetical protein